MSIVLNFDHRKSNVSTELNENRKFLNFASKKVVISDSLTS